jgi:hypothetical protein
MPPVSVFAAKFLSKDPVRSMQNPIIQPNLSKTLDGQFDLPVDNALAHMRQLSRASAPVTAECADNYVGLVALLNGGWRVVECRDRLQWILQRRGSPESSRADDWRGRSYCQTRFGLLRCARAHAGDADPGALAVLAALPERIELTMTMEGVS